MFIKIYGCVNCVLRSRFNGKELCRAVHMEIPEVLENESSWPEWCPAKEDAICIKWQPDSGKDGN